MDCLSCAPGVAGLDSVSDVTVAGAAAAAPASSVLWRISRAISTTDSTTDIGDGLPVGPRVDTGTGLQRPRRGAEVSFGYCCVAADLLGGPGRDLLAEIQHVHAV